jgi:hypothetical protein
MWCVRADGTSAHSSLLVVNPGLRFAINTPWGLQTVPGVSAPIQLDAEGTTFAALAYLSFEHTLWQSAAARP